MMSQYKVSAWYDWSEWITVKHQLYQFIGFINKTTTKTNNDNGIELTFNDNIIKSIQNGLDIIQCWRCRVPSLPVAIESTSQLFYCIISLYQYKQYKNQNNHVNQYNEQQLRHLISMAIVRLVNSFVDLQQKQYTAQSVTQLATQLQLSRICVDIRHESTHNILPSIEYLELGMNDALLWLYNTYWCIQYDILHYTDHTIIQLINGYKLLYINQYKSGIICQKLCDICQTNTTQHQLIGILLTESNLIKIPVRYQLSVTKSRCYTIMKKLITKYNRLLHTLHKSIPNFTINLLSTLISRLNQSNNDSHHIDQQRTNWINAIYSSWSIYCLSIVTKISNDDVDTDKLLLDTETINDSTNDTLIQLFRQCMQQLTIANYTVTLQLLQHIQSKFTRSQIQQFNMLLDIYNTTNNIDSTEVNNHITEQHLQELQQQCDTAVDTNNAVSPWGVAINWTPCYIGTTDTDINSGISEEFKSHNSYTDDYTDRNDEWVVVPTSTSHNNTADDISISSNDKQRLLYKINTMF